MTGKVDLETPFGTIAVYEVDKPVSVLNWLSDHAAAVNGPLVVIVNDVAILRADWNAQLIGPNDRAAIVMLPGRSRGSVKSIIRAIATIGLAIAATAVAGPIGAAIGITSSIGISLIGAGVFLAGSIVLNRLLPASTAPDQPQQQNSTQSPTYSLQAQGNYARIGSIIPKLYGNHLVFPDFAASTWSFFEPVFSVQLVNFFFCLGFGEYDVEQIFIGGTLAWDSATGASSTYPALTVQIVPPGSVPTLFHPYYFTSPDVGGFDLLSTQVYGPYVAVPPGYKATALEFDFIMPNGLSFTNSSGVLFPIAVSVSCDYQEIDNRGNPIGPWVQATTTYAMLATDAIRRTVSISVPAGRYQARVIRLDFGSGTTLPAYIDDINWTTLKAVLSRDSNDADLTAFTYSDTTTLLIRVAATDRISAQSSHQISVLMTSKLPEWNSLTGWSAPVPTRKIAASVSDILRANYGAQLEDPRIDVVKLWTELQNTWDARGDTCDRIFDTKLSIWDAIAAVLKCGRTRPIMIGGKVSFVRDEPRVLYKQSFTPRNIRPNTLEVSYVMQDVNLPDDVLITFVNRDTWKPDSVRCSISGTFGTSPITYDYTGIGTPEHATREGMYQAANNKYRRKYAVFQTELENRFLLLGDLINISSDVPMWGQWAEPIAIAGEQVTLDKDLDWSALPAQYYATLSTFDGKVLSPMKVTRIADNIFTLDATDFANAATAINHSGATLLDLCVSRGDGRSRVESRVIFGPSRITAMDMLVTGVVPDAQLLASIETVNEDMRVHTADGT